MRLTTEPAVLPLLAILLHVLSFTDACFSTSRDKRQLLERPEEIMITEKPAAVHSAPITPESQPQKDHKEREEVIPFNARKTETPLTDKFIAAYLREYRYIRRPFSTAGSSISREEMFLGIKRFQQYAGIGPASGQMDNATAAAIMKKRCENADFATDKSLIPIWERSTLKYSIEGIPPGGFGEELSEHDVKELVRQAFSAWEIVISLDFIEIPSQGSNGNRTEQADIEFVFVDDDEVAQPKWQGGLGGKPAYEENLIKTGLGIASATPPTHSRIVFAARERWSTFQVQEEGSKLDIFLVLIHQIGHALGLSHSPDRQSVMFPLFERKVGEQLPVISNEDVDRLRALYAPDDTEIHSDLSKMDELAEDVALKAINASPADAETKHIARNDSDGGHRQGENEHRPSRKQKDCPRKLTAATQVPSTGDIFIFDEGRVWRFDRDRNGFKGPRLITELFPDSPAAIDVAISGGFAQSLNVLIHERMMYGYVWDLERGEFKSAQGFPQPLHNRVLFYPEAAFPLVNGSVVLVKDDVFATLDLVENVPLMLNDKRVFFPGLPRELRAGVLESPDSERTYYMLTDREVFVYDTAMRSSKIAVPLAEFLRCDE